MAKFKKTAVERRPITTRCMGIANRWPNLEPGATTWVVVVAQESSDETLRWTGRRP
jgi:hypothetical protein